MGPDSNALQQLLILGSLGTVASSNAGRVLRSHDMAGFHGWSKERRAALPYELSLLVKQGLANPLTRLLAEAKNAAAAPGVSAGQSGSPVQRRPRQPLQLQRPALKGGLREGLEGSSLKDQYL